MHASLDGQTPHGVFHSQLENVKFLENPSILDSIFLKREQRKVKADGTITLNKQLYEVPPRYIGQSIDVRLDDQDVFVYEEGKEIAKLKLVSMKDNARVKRNRSPFSVPDQKEEHADV